MAAAVVVIAIVAASGHNVPLFGFIGEFLVLIGAFNSLSLSSAQISNILSPSSMSFPVVTSSRMLAATIQIQPPPRRCRRSTTWMKTAI